MSGWFSCTRTIYNSPTQPVGTGHPPKVQPFRVYAALALNSNSTVQQLLWLHGAWVYIPTMDFNGFHGFQLISVDFNGIQWISMDFNGFQWISMELNGFTTLEVFVFQASVTWNRIKSLKIYTKTGPIDRRCKF